MSSTISTFLTSLSSTDKAVLAAGGVWIVYLLSRSNGGPAPLPPGPRPLPLVGNMFQIPQKDEWPVYEAWAKKYGRPRRDSLPVNTFVTLAVLGPITYLTMLGTPMIVLNSLKAIRELLEERSATYSNRPLMAMKELCDLDWVLTYISGEPHRVRRATVQRYFSGPASVKHRHHQQEESRVLAANLLRRPDALDDHIKQHTSSSILLGTYGYRVSGTDDPIVHEMERSFKQAEELNGPLAFLIEIGPNLKNWPNLLSLSGFRKTVDEIKHVFNACRVDPFKRSRNMIDDGTAVPCFVSTSLDTISSETSLSPIEVEKKEELIMDCASVMYAAATDSTSCTLRCFFALMALHPEVMRRAQEGIDNVTETERLPTFDDWERLPYITAIILEVLRYNTVTPLGLPHGVAKDDIYDGILIPKGSMICANVWLIYHDPEIFPDPYSFKPERFMGENGARGREVMNMTWGFGRRTCPGKQFAEAVLFITVSTVITCFDIEPKRSSTGEAPTLTFYDGFIRRPKPFPMTIRPRSDKWAWLLDP
ncbi:Cytochrome P450 monooxygenase 208 [Psilocybe cubensis]|uniref:Cytochrome P450 n=2 Tax=Psilocybe cubensis TaxID=181762 RepID=A0A8H8CJI5_PSICU|nr:Cytochrome P450 monooxygenase 208 [Psilocybe cubensis]KAH9475818.1 Cytochrome P450 monooxygenase 208 [Psilocybe cubensis]